MSAFKVRLDHLTESVARRRAAAAPDDVKRLTARIQTLESMVEALQDSVDRLAKRHDTQLTELSRRLTPGEVARSLSDDARRRGL